MEDQFVPVRVRRQGKMVPVLQFISVAPIGVPFIGVLIAEGWPLSASHWPWATAVGAGLMLILIETRLAELLNQAQDLNSLLQNIVKQPDSEDVDVRDIVRLHRVIFSTDRRQGS